MDSQKTTRLIPKHRENKKQLKTKCAHTPMKFEGIPELVFVGTPVKIGRSIGSSLYEKLPKAEKMAIAEAAKAIY
jgi:hypothetical protein